ncbi:MAG: tryptophan transporter [Sporolactobacillus sp.]
MKLRNLIIVAMFLAIGTVLHAVFPGMILGMKSDLSLIMLFLALFFFADRRSFFIIGLVAGILAGLTTSLPGGFFPNIIDKVVTSTIVFTAFSLISRSYSRKGKYILGVILAAIGTILSGTVFLISAIIITNLTIGAFAAMFVGMVLPTAVVNTVLFAILYPLVAKIGERAGFIKIATTPVSH